MIGGHPNHHRSYYFSDNTQGPMKDSKNQTNTNVITNKAFFVLDLSNNVMREKTCTYLYIAKLISNFIQGCKKIGTAVPVVLRKVSVQ